MKIEILGTIYKVEFKTNKQDKRLQNCDGYCDYSIKTIVVIKRKKEDADIMDVENLKIVDNRTLRHEIIHAFMYESGLWCNSEKSINWAMNEEMTDWFAIQSPKIFKVYHKLGIDKD